LGIEIQCIYTDDGIVMRVPEADEAPPSEGAFLEPEEIDDVVVAQVGNSALFASRFRECAARALLLPKRRPGTRTPLWQQRQKSAHLLQVASRHGTFPIMLETFRECLQDVFDVPALTELMGAIRRREVRVVEVDTAQPSPFASSLQFGFVNAFMYEGDSPLAERRAQALSLDRSLLAEIMGHEELRELIDQGALAEIELELQFLTDDRRFRDADDIADGLRLLGDLSTDEIRARSRRPDAVDDHLEGLARERRVVAVRIAGDERWIAIEDAGRYRDALGTALPMGVPDAFLEPVSDPLGELIGRFARRRGPFVVEDVAGRFGIGRAVAAGALDRLAAAGRVADGEFRPGGSGREWVDVEVLRRIRRRSLAAFRKEIEPAPADAFARFGIAWQGVHSVSKPARASSLDDLYSTIERLQGTPIPASALERQVLAARLPGYQSSMLDQLGASGELVWCGAGAIGSDDGWIVLALADKAPLLLPEPQPEELSPTAARIRDALDGGGALFFRQIAEEIGSTDDTELLLSLWELVWAGHATNDTMAPLRALTAGARLRRPRAASHRRGPSFPSRLGPPTAAGRWSLISRTPVDPTRRMHALGEQLLERHGIVTRGAVMSERIPGGFAGVYRVLKAMEEAGRCRRGYFVEGLGGAQFATPGAVDRMRALVEKPDRPQQVHVMAATDPANPYGAALPWPERESAHRPGRKTGAIVVVVDGDLVLYVEKGGRTLLSFTEEEQVIAPAVDALALAAREGSLGKLAVERADGGSVFGDTPLSRALVEAGFKPTSRGLRLRA
jgi:ATP-dependent Lhr-like helicase